MKFRGIVSKLYISLKHFFKQLKKRWKISKFVRFSYIVKTAQNLDQGTTSGLIAECGFQKLGKVEELDGNMPLTTNKKKTLVEADPRTTIPEFASELCVSGEKLRSQKSSKSGCRTN